MAFNVDTIWHRGITCIQNISQNLISNRVVSFVCVSWCRTWCRIDLLSCFWLTGKGYALHFLPVVFHPFFSVFCLFLFLCRLSLSEDPEGQLSTEEEEARKIAEMGKPVLGEHSRLEVVIEESYEFKVLHLKTWKIVSPYFIYFILFSVLLLYYYIYYYNWGWIYYKVSHLKH